MRRSIKLLLFIVMCIYIITMCSCKLGKKTVTFVDDDGSVIYTIDVKKGDTIDKPRNPIKEGYKFKGWYQNGKSWFFIKNVVEEDITLVAKWEMIITDLTFWAIYNYDMQNIYDYLKNDFETKYPMYKLNIENYYYTSSMDSSLTRAISRDETPSVAVTDFYYINNYLPSGKIVDLNKYINDENKGFSADELNQYYSNVFETSTATNIEGIRYSFPFTRTTDVMYYNKNVFDEYGWEVPTTWDEVIAVTEEWKKTDHYQKIVNGTYAECIYGLGYDRASNAFVTLTEQYGGTYVSFDKNGNSVYNAFGDVELDMLKSKQAVDWFHTHSEKRNIGTDCTFAFSYGYQEFLHNHCLMLIGSSANPEDYDGQNASTYKFETGVAPIPQKDKNNPKNIQNGQELMLFKKENKLEEIGGWRLIQYLTSFDTMLYLAKETNYLPFRKDVINSKEYQEYLNINSTVSNSVEKVKRLTKLAATVEVNNLIPNIAVEKLYYASPGEIVMLVLNSDFTLDQAYKDKYNQIHEIYN